MKDSEGGKCVILKVTCGETKTPMSVYQTVNENPFISLYSLLREASETLK